LGRLWPKPCKSGSGLMRNAFTPRSWPFFLKQRKHRKRKRTPLRRSRDAAFNRIIYAVAKASALPHLVERRLFRYARHIRGRALIRWEQKGQGGMPMTEEDAAGRYREACGRLPERRRQAALALVPARQARAEELRLRVGHPLAVTLPE